MTIRVVLAMIDGGPGSETALRTALAISDPLGAHVQCLHVRPDPESLVPMIGEGMSGVMLDQMVEGFRSESMERAAAARRIFDQVTAERSGAVTGASSATFAFREEEGREDEIAARLGRVHDLTVLTRSDRQTGLPAVITLETALLQSGRPVLVAPAAAPSSIGRRILLAWNGKAQSARALASSLPLLARAERVVVLTVVESHTPGRPAEVVRYLAWHGIRAEGEEVPTTGSGKVGQLILQHAQTSAVDLLVMGAYGHSRLKEMILGGATREVLGHAKLPLLMAH